MIVAVNKMDEKSVEFNEDRFMEIKKEVTTYLQKIGYDVSKIPMIPISGWLGDNITELSKNMPWYKGPTLLGKYHLSLTMASNIFYQIYVFFNDRAFNFLFYKML